MKIDLDSVKTQMGILCSLILIILASTYVWVLHTLGVVGYLIMAVSLPVILSVYQEIGYNRDAKDVFPTWCVSLMEGSVKFGFQATFINGAFALVLCDWDVRLMVTAWIAYWLVHLIFKRILIGRPLEIGRENLKWCECE
jgi:hypothetical protein